ncbi:MAG: 50S ribosomal protein L29 [Planctomycetota bacterium]
MKRAINEIRGDGSTELQAKLNDLRKEQFELRFKPESGKTTRHREVRRTIARILFVLGERARTGATGSAGAAPAAAAAPATASKPKAAARPKSAAKPKTGAKP